MGNNVWILVEHARGEAQSVTFEMLDEARRIATRLKGQVVALVLGHRLPDLAATLASYGADLVYLCDHPLLAEYTTDAYTCGLNALIEERDPFLVFLAATVNGRDLAPRLAARMRLGLASDCTMVKLNNAGVLEATRPTHRDKIYTTVALTSSPPFLATLRPGAIGVGKPELSRQAVVEAVSVPIDAAVIRARVLHTTRADPATLDVAEAEIVVSGGRGLGNAENWHLVEELAEALGAAVGGSRMAMDEGWIPRERLVGQTGKSIGPRLYVTLGISGAKEHVLGARDAKNLLAINIDPGAPIFGVADKSIVGNINEVVPVFVRKLRELNGKQDPNNGSGSGKASER